MSRARGRPPRDKAAPSTDDMLSAALELLDAGNIEAFTMRALAERLQINAMTIYHHFGDRDGLIAAMSEKVYRDVSAPASGTPRSRIEALLQAYHAKVLRHPGFTLLIFSRPTIFPEQARRITEDVAALLSEAGLSPQRSRLWLDILVDFTHGAAVATAMGPGSASASPRVDNGYNLALTELLDGLAN